MRSGGWGGRGWDTDSRIVFSSPIHRYSYERRRISAATLTWKCFASFDRGNCYDLRAIKLVALRDRKLLCLCEIIETY